MTQAASRLDVRGQGASLAQPAVLTLSNAHGRQPRHFAHNALIAQWPILAEEAFYGLAGDVVRELEPHTEADTAALLIQLLAGFGNLIGRHPYFEAEADRHHTNLFVVLVGETAKGRKGTSWGRVRRVLDVVDRGWTQNRVMSGLSSGEGLIDAVRDAVEDKRGEIVDQGIEDKRLLVVESEFSAVLRQASRDRNILSAVLRQAWDVGWLRNMVVSSPRRATDAHISLIGHITRDELLRQITDTDVANGLANRFLWVCVRRSKLLPEGGGEPTILPHVERLKVAALFARRITRVRRDDEARELWRSVYGPLSEGKPGLLGAVIARSEAQVMRLSLIFAVLDCSQRIRMEHLAAGLAVWQYAEDSARYIFGTRMGDAIADVILGALRARPEGMSRDAMRSDLFGRHKTSDEISRALERLRGMGLAMVESHPTGGRAAEVWRAI